MATAKQKLAQPKKPVTMPKSPANGQKPSMPKKKCK